MELASARELKASLVDSVLTPLAENLSRRAAFGTPTRPMAAALSQPAEALALGIAPAGRRQFQLAVRVQQRSMLGSRELDLIRRRAKNEVEVRYVGRAVKRAVPWHQQRHRPLRIGTSIGHFRITAGTLGCFVRRRGEEDPLILSNNHVLANENRGRRGDAVLQPGALDDGRKPQDAVGALADFVKLKKRGANLVDCALASVEHGIEFNHRNVRGLGNIAGLGDVAVDEGDAVAKVGRTTGKTTGRVTAFELDRLVVEFDIGLLRFDNQIEIDGEDEMFSDGGDSGSLILDAGRRAVALLFAGTETGGSEGTGLTYANPLPAVLDALGAELYP